MTKATPTKKAAPKKKTGAKARGPYENKRAVLTTRITGKTRKALENAAAMSGRSLSQEIEHRLERSFLVEDSLGLIGIHPEIARLIKNLLDAQRVIEMRTGAPVGNDSESAIAFGSAMSVIARQFSKNKTPSKVILEYEKKQEKKFQKRHKKRLSDAKKGAEMDILEFPDDKWTDSPIIRSHILGQTIGKSLTGFKEDEDPLSDLNERIHKRYIEELKRQDDDYDNLDM